MIDIKVESACPAHKTGVFVTISRKIGQKYKTCTFWVEKFNEDEQKIIRLMQGIVLDLQHRRPPSDGDTLTVSGLTATFKDPK